MNKNKYFNLHFANRKSEATYVSDGNLYLTEWGAGGLGAFGYRFLS